MHPLPPEIMYRVFIVTRNKKDFETAFAVPVDGVFYFITAAHLFEKISSDEQKEIFFLKDNGWHKVDSAIFIPDATWDLVVIKTNIPVSDNELNIELSSKNLIVGQDLYFLGFPHYKLIGYPCEKNNNGYPIPLIKKATLSGVQPPIMLLNGYNNLGCAGGPVIFWDYVENRHKICGVIGGYITGKTEEMFKISSDLHNYENLGIAIAYDIFVINEIIQSVREGLP